MDICKKSYIFSLILIAFVLFVVQMLFPNDGFRQNVIFSTLIRKYFLINNSSLVTNYSKNATEFKKLFTRGNLSTTEFRFSTQSPADPACGYFVRSVWGGGLGNRMFVYASYYGMVKKQNKVNKIVFVGVDDELMESSAYLDKVFENLSIPRKNVTESWFKSRNFITLNEAKPFYYDRTGMDRLLCDGKNFLMSGCRSSFRYFDTVFEEIKKEFTFKKSIRKNCRRLFDDSFSEKKLDRKKCVVVGVHLRRGDFATDSWGHWPANVDYLKKAIRYHEILHFENGTRKIECLVFMIFGNTYAWNVNATKQLKLLRPKNSHLILIDSNKTSASIDMCAMGLCDHMITSTGTYSWWAGFFNRGVVTYQKEFARPNSAHYYEFEPKDYFFPHWIGL